MVRQLLKKEFYLQRSSLAFALAVVLVWGALMALTPQAARVLIPKRLTMGQLVSLMQAFFVGPCLLGIIPLLVGAAMVAEERSLGVWDWHLSLPASRRRQWVIKLAVGTLITLLPALLIQPVLDKVMNHALAGRGDPFPLPMDYLRFNAGYIFLPLLLMAAGAFVSSLAADPYKAFFGGLVIFIAALACTRLTDPASLLLLPWQKRAPDGSQYLIMKNLGPLLIIMISAILGWLAWFNFRYEGLRWRRLILEVIGMILLVSAATDVVLRCEFSPKGLISQQAKDVESLITAERRGLGFDPPAVNWTGIEPLLVRRFTPGLRANRRGMDFWSRKPFGRFYRLSGTSRLLAEVNSFPAHFPSDDPTGWHQIVEIDLTTHQLRPIYQLTGYISQVIPKYSAFTIHSPLRDAYLITQWPVPIKVGGLLWSFWASHKSFNLSNPPYPSMNDIQALIDGSTFKYESISTVNSSQGLYQIYVKHEFVHEIWLIRRKSDGSWSLVDKQQAYTPYAVSSDGKWFTRNPRINRAYPPEAADALKVFSMDRITSWTIASPQGNLMLCGNQPENPYWIVRDGGFLGANNKRNMLVSPSGRFLPLLRAKTIKLQNMKGVLRDTGYPERVEIGVLDLQNGKESILIKTEPERPVQERFKEQMQKWLWAKWVMDSGNELGKNLGRIGPNLPANMYENPPVYYQTFPSMVWAPGRDKLAILYDGRIHLFDYRPEFARRAWKTFEKMGGFVPAGIIDLIGFQTSDLDFWDGKTILAWGNLGLFKIDLPEATRPRPSAKTIIRMPPNG